MNFKALLITTMVVLLALTVAVSGCTTPTPTVAPTVAPTVVPTTSTTIITATAAASTPVASTATAIASTPDTAPKTYTGTGPKSLGPISLKPGSTTVTIKCTDAGNSGFIVTLQDTSGNSVKGLGIYNSGMLYTNVAGTTITNNIDVTKTYSIPTAGDYLIDVSCNNVAQWEVSVSQ